MNKTRSVGVLVALAAFGGLVSAPAASAICKESGRGTEVRLYASYDGAQKGSVRAVNATQGLLGSPVVVDSMRALTVASRPAPGWSVGMAKPFTLLLRGSSRVVDVTRGPDDALVIAMWRKLGGQSGCTYVKVAKATSAAASVVPVLTGGDSSNRDPRLVTVSNPNGAGPVEVDGIEVVGKGWGITSAYQGPFTVPVGGSKQLAIAPGYAPGTLLLTLKDGTVVSHPLRPMMVTYPFHSSSTTYTDDAVNLVLGDHMRRGFQANVASVDVPNTGGWKQTGGEVAPFALASNNTITLQRGSVDSVAVVTYAGGLFEGYQVRAQLNKAPNAPATAVVPVLTGGDGSSRDRVVGVKNPSGSALLEVVKTEVVGEGWSLAQNGPFTVPAGGSVQLGLYAGYVPATLLLTLKDGTVVGHRLTPRMVTMPYVTLGTTYTNDSVTVRLGDDLHRSFAAQVSSVHVPNTAGWKQTGGFAPFTVERENTLTFARGSADTVAVVTYSGGLFEGYQIRVPLKKAPPVR